MKVLCTPGGYMGKKLVSAMRADLKLEATDEEKTPRAVTPAGTRGGLYVPGRFAIGFSAMWAMQTLSCSRSAGVSSGKSVRRD